MTIWTIETDVDDRPFYGPPCPGYHTHRWTLTVEEESVSLHSGCQQCDLNIELYELFAEVSGRLEFHHDHDGARGCPNAIRMLPCDCNYWWQFTPEVAS